MLKPGIYLENMEKLRELILYICRASESDEAFGKVKLNKLLFFSDFSAYVDLGQSITRQDYKKLKQGPVPNLIDRKSVV